MPFCKHLSISPFLVAAVLAMPGRAAAENVLANPGFDTSLEGWKGLSLTTWVAGTAKVIKSPGPAIVPGPHQGCFEVQPGTTLVAGGAAMIAKATGPRTPWAYWILYAYSEPTCTTYRQSDSLVVFANTEPDGAWRSGTTTWTVPEGVHGIMLGARHWASDNAAEEISYFDDAVLDFPDPAPPSETWLTTEGLPGYRFQARIGGARIGILEGNCLGETLCISGAVAGRAEVLVRIVGPKPNGYLWPNVIRFSTSQVEVWIEQISSGSVKYYNLEAADPNAGILDGLFDRTGFLP